MRNNITFRSSKKTKSFKIISSVLVCKVFLSECAADQRCCAGGEEYAISLYEDTDIPKVEAIECYFKIRKLVIAGKESPDQELSFKCLDAFFRSCAEYIQFRNEGKFTPITEHIEITMFMSSGIKFIRRDQKQRKNGKACRANVFLVEPDIPDINRHLRDFLFIMHY